jgi:predicted nucleic acid-binding protein
MFVVVDANELFSILIKGTEKSESILFSDEVELIAPEFLLIEFANNEQEILSKTHRSKKDFSILLSIFERRIKFLPREEFNDFIPQALEILKENPKDAPYVALALKFNCLIWSEDKGLKKHARIKVLNTAELFKELESR